jgi:hypothetical protein
MRAIAIAGVALVLMSGAQAAEWQALPVNTPARVTAIDAGDGQVRIEAGGLWYRLTLTNAKPALAFVDAPAQPEPPDNALPHGHVVTGTRDVARAWFAEPTPRYDHGVLGDKVEAGSLVIETRDGKIQTVRLKDDAVFEDLTPRLADLDGDGRDEIVVVKSYLKQGSALAVIGQRSGKYGIIAETPPIGGPHRWLNPAGIADFTGDGKADIALVRQPHVLGQLELWTWSGGRLTKTAELADTSNHIAGSRALGMSVVADFDGDGIADLALPSLDRTRLRIISFVPSAHEIASVALPAKVMTDLARVATGKGAPAVAIGLANGALVLVRERP